MTKKKDWQAKYREMTLELEKAESSILELREQIKITLSLISLATQGIDTALDDSLGLLIKRLPDLNDADLFEHIKALEKPVYALDSHNQEILNRIVALLKQWHQTCIEEAHTRSQTQKQIQASDTLDAPVQPLSEMAIDLHAENYEVLPELITQLLEMQRSAMHFSKPSLTNGQHSPTKFINKIKLVIQEMLVALQVSANNQSAVDALSKQLDLLNSVSDLPDILKELISLIQLSRSTAGNDFEDYLKSLNLQLSHLENFLLETKAEDADMSQQRNLLDVAVRKDVNKIHEVMHQSLELADLKEVVNDKLDSIIKAMDGYKKNERQRERSYNERYERLLNKIAEMENEAEKIKNRIEEEQLKAMTDHLTGLPNRYGYDRYVTNEIERWRRYQIGFSIAVSDIDFFKRVNDNYGHLAGDKVLRLIAKILRDKLRKIDMICRIGGEEFVVIMPSTARETCFSVLDNIRKKISETPFHFQGEPVTITMSFGLTDIRQEDNAETLFARADTLLYEAKNSGRNKIISD